MGIPAFYRWVSEKYPKIVQDVLEERVKLVNDVGSVKLPFDATRPNPSGLECDNLYIDMNGIIHPASHPEEGPQPTCEEEMYENVCAYVDRLFRAMRPRRLLYLAIDGVAPRAKMNQQRSRRFRSAQEAREKLEVEESIRQDLIQLGHKVPPRPVSKPWDSNVITPGTPFMLKLSVYVRNYIRKRLKEDKAWKQLKIIFSDASIPGEGEHKIMAHIRLQRSQPSYNPNLVHVLHGLDADLIMLGLATHEAHFYISREEVLFGRKSQEMTERRQLESGHRDKQRALDIAAGEFAMELPENKQKPLCRVSIPILREYLAVEFASCLQPGRLPFEPSLERLIDDIVFLCFFVGNDFLPHLPSLDIRDGALDFLFNVYKRLLPSLGGYITNHGGNVNLSHVDVILAEVGAIEDYVFSMRHETEQRNKERIAQQKAQRKNQKGNPDAPPSNPIPQPKPKVLGRAARILEKNSATEHLALKKKGEIKIKASHMQKTEDNLAAALALKESLNKLAAGGTDRKETMSPETKAESVADVTMKTEDVKEDQEDPSNMRADNNDDSKVDGPEHVPSESSENTKKRKLDEVASEPGIGIVGDIKDEFDVDDDDDDDDDDDEDEDAPKLELPPDVCASSEIAAVFKEKVSKAQQQKLDEYANNIDDKVRLHETGWKDRYYTDKCKADNVEKGGGREHLFRSYVVGLVWVMKYYYDGCPSWKWYYPFHYAPFASDLKNIERFQKDVQSFEQSTPFNPVEQLMAVLPSDSSHAIPKASQWLMLDKESPIIDFYPEDVPVDPNGKAMPWLWVVLLPFIDEDRLLAAMTPTMAKWTKEELLCNARGLDDGYLYIHSSHSLASKVNHVLESGSKTLKTRLNGSSASEYAGFTGALRLPLSNEIAPTDDNSTNECLCAAFTEPAKLSHKSVLLPGAIPPEPSLTNEDMNIRRPRLNRGGQSIANLGVSNGQSYKSGYGSMNISSYERELAQRTGRGNQMYQAGTRTWGSLQPVPKQQRFQPQNPFQLNNTSGPPPPPPPPPHHQHQPNAYPNPNYNRGPMHHQQQPHQNPNRHPQPNRYPQQQQHHQQPNMPFRGPPNQQMPQQRTHPGGNVYSQQQPHQYQHQRQYQQPYQQHQQNRGANSNPNNARPSGFNFRAFNQLPGPGAPPPPPPPAPPFQQQRPQRAPGVNMDALKSQLKNTLSQNNRGGGRR